MADARGLIIGDDIVVAGIAPARQGRDRPRRTSLGIHFRVPAHAGGGENGAIHHFLGSYPTPNVTPHFLGSYPTPNEPRRRSMGGPGGDMTCSTYTNYYWHSALGLHPENLPDMRHSTVHLLLKYLTTPCIHANDNTKPISPFQACTVPRLYSATVLAIKGPAVGDTFFKIFARERRCLSPWFRYRNRALPDRHRRRRPRCHRRGPYRLP
jgi:hypothetical protein